MVAQLSVAPFFTNAYVPFGTVLHGNPFLCNKFYLYEQRHVEKVEMCTIFQSNKHTDGNSKDEHMEVLSNTVATKPTMYYHRN